MSTIWELDALEETGRARQRAERAERERAAWRPIARDDPDFGQWGCTIGRDCLDGNVMATWRGPGFAGACDPCAVTLGLIAEVHQPRTRSQWREPVVEPLEASDPPDAAEIRFEPEWVVTWVDHP